MNKKGRIYRFIGWFFLANTFLFWLLGFEFLKATFLSKTLFFDAVVSYSGILGKILIVSFILINYLSYMMLLAFIPALFLLIIAFLLPYKRLIVLFSVLFATLSIALLIIDSRIYSMFKFHLNFTILSMIFHTKWNEVFDFSRAELVFCLMILGLICLLEFYLAWFVWQKIVITERFRIGKFIAFSWFGGFFFCYYIVILSVVKNVNLFSHHTLSLPHFNQVLSYLIPSKDAWDTLRRFSESDFAQPFFPNDQMNYPLHRMRCDKPSKPYNVILIMADALRFDTVQKGYMPNLTNFAKKSWQFQNHLSGGNSTQPGLFSLFYSVPSNYWTAALNQKIPAVLTSLFIDNDYSFQIFWSSVLYNPSFDKTIFRGLTDLELDGSSKDNIGDKDRDITQKAINFLEKKDHKTPFFLYLFYDAPHGFCREQNFPAPYQPIYKECSRIALTNDTDPLPFYNRYLMRLVLMMGKLPGYLIRLSIWDI